MTRKIGLLVVFGGVLALPVLAQDAVSAATPLSVPSGVVPRLQEWLLDTQPNGDVLARFRFVAPEIERAMGRFSQADLEGDFQVLCQEFALFNVAAQPTEVDRIVISLADREVEFGYADPDATQYFEAFRVENATCIWEFF
ncbi:MAG: DUF6497 family protein [Rhodobacterales bacterium]|nr:DUF6497 family protein [Rhodobacterales bacterium]